VDRGQTVRSRRHCFMRVGVVAVFIKTLNANARQASTTGATRSGASSSPRFDEDFLAAQKARQQQARDMGIMP